MSYIGKSPHGTGVRSRYYYTAVGSETSLSGADDNGRTLTFSDGAYVDVLLNGTTLVAGTDYNTTTANTISGLSALVASDVVEVIVYDIFTVADTVSAKNGGTFSGSVDFVGGLTVDGNSIAGTKYLSVNATGTVASATGTDAIAIGEAVTVANNNGIGIGRNITTVQPGSVVIGNGATTSAGGGAQIAIGTNADSTGTGGVAIGYNSEGGDDSVALGESAVASGNDSTSLGYHADATALSSVAIGAFANAGHTNGTALGRGSATTADNQIALGQSGAQCKIFDTTGGTWTFGVDTSGNLVFYFGGTAKIKFASDGEIVTVDDVTAFGTI